MTQDLNNNNENEPEEETLGKQVDELLEKGYSQREIVKQGFSGGLVRQRIRKRVKRLGKQPPASNGGGKKDEIALTIKEKETVLPEWLEGQVSELFDGSVAQQKAFIAGMAIPLLGMRMWAEGCKPLLELMRVDQARQAEAAKAAQGGSEDVAQRTVIAALPYFTDAMKEVAKINAPKEINPVSAMMVRLMEPMLGNMFGGMFKGMLPQGQGQGQGQSQQSNLPPGWVDERGQQ
jgi:hypothetical protein